MLHKTLAVGIVALVAIALASVAYSDGDKLPTAEADFDGKIVVVGTENERCSAYLRNTRVQVLAGRKFLVGDFVNAPEGPNYPEIGYWIPLDRIEIVCVYNSAEDARAVYELRGKHHKEKQE